MSTNVTILVSISLGLGVGTLASVAYFIHLAKQIGNMVNKRSDGSRLLLGAALRMSVLLIVGWLLSVASGPFSTIGYCVAFLLVRTFAIQRVRNEVWPCN